MDMIERIAKAIGDTFAAEHDRLVEAAMSGAVTPVADELMTKCARAAIEAMREPTPEMLDRSWDTVVGLQASDYIATELAAPKDAHRFKTAKRWRAMIDAALRNPAPVSRETQAAPTA